MKTYVAVPSPAGPGSITVDNDGARYPLKHHTRHSPDGFSWGYGGSGPSDTARCILIDHFGDDAICQQCDDGKIDSGEGPERCWFCGGEVFVQPTPAMYQAFKFEVIANFPIESSFELTSKEIEDWLDGFRAKHADEAARAA